VYPHLALIALLAVASGIVAATTRETGAALETPTHDELLRFGRSVVSGGGDMPEGMACLPCHGLAGEGDAETGVPRIAGLTSAYLLKQLDDYAEERRTHPIMTPIAQAMSGTQRLASALHYSELAADEPSWLPPAKADPARLQRGALLYTRGSAALGLAGCINCHGPQAIGTAATYPALAGQHASYVSAQLHAWREGSRRNSIAGVMEHIAGQLGEEDIEDMAAYLSTLTPARMP
jgi:cytochrome c553